MAEAAGVAIGTVGLATLFSSCVQCFEFFQMTRTMTLDVRSMHQRLANQKLRFIKWGQSLGLAASLEGGEAPSGISFSPTLLDNINKTMILLKSVFEDVETLERRFGMSFEKNRHPKKRISGTPNETKTPSNLTQRLQDKFRLKFRPGRGRRTCLWVISDRRRFQELLDHVNGLITELEVLTKSEISAEVREENPETDSTPRTDSFEEIFAHRENSPFLFLGPSRPTLSPISARGSEHGSTTTSFFTASEGRYRYQNFPKSLKRRPRKSKNNLLRSGSDAEGEFDPDIQVKLHSGNFLKDPYFEETDIFHNIREGNQDTVLALLRSDTALQQAEYLDFNPLEYAIKLGQEPISLLLLREYPMLLGSKSRPSPFIQAVRYGLAQLVSEMLMYKDCKPHERNSKGDNAFSEAIYRHNPVVALILARHDATLIATRDSQERSSLAAFLIAIVSTITERLDPVWIELCTLLLESRELDISQRHSSDPPENSALELAIHRYDTTFTKRIVKTRPDAIRNSTHDLWDFVMLQWIGHNTHNIHSILECCPDLLSRRDSSQRLPIHKAAEYQANKILHILLQRPEINVFEKWRGWSVLHIATSAGDLECVKMLLEHEPTLALDVHCGWTALMVASHLFLRAGEFSGLCSLQRSEAQALSQSRVSPALHELYRIAGVKTPSKRDPSRAFIIMACTSAINGYNSMILITEYLRTVRAQDQKDKLQDLAIQMMEDPDCVANKEAIAYALQLLDSNLTPQTRS